MDTRALLIQALGKKQAASAEVKRWSEFVTHLLELEPTLAEVLLQLDRDDQAVLPFVDTDVQAAYRAQRGDGRISDTEAAVIEIIRAQGGGYVQTRALLPLIQQRGIEVGGKDPYSTLAARLSRSDKLIGMRGRGWTIRHPAQTNEAADPTPTEGQSAASVSTPDDAVARGEVEHNNMTT
jgi:hypothetical protein